MEYTILTASVAGAIGYIVTLPLDYIKQHLQCSTDKTLLYREIKTNGIKPLFKGGLIGCYSIVPQMAIKFTVNETLPFKNAYLNGFLAGYVDGSFLGPILSLQSMQQMRTNYGYKEAITILRKVPILSLTFPLAFRNATYTSIMFGGAKTLDWESTLLSATVLNIPAVLVCSPFDVIRANQIRNMVLGKANHPVAIAQGIYKKEGIKGFYRGVGSLYINFALRFPLTFTIFNYLNGK
jgi:Mitochondrial carrier protein